MHLSKLMWAALREMAAKETGRACAYDLKRTTDLPISTATMSALNGRRLVEGPFGPGTIFSPATCDYRITDLGRQYVEADRFPDRRDG